MSSALRDQGQTVVVKRPLQAPFDGASVLVVSDDPTLCESARVVLGDHGYDVRSAPIKSSTIVPATSDVDVITPVLFADGFEDLVSLLAPATTRANEPTWKVQ